MNSRDGLFLEFLYKSCAGFELSRVNMPDSNFARKKVGLNLMKLVRERRGKYVMLENVRIVIRRDMLTRTVLKRLQMRRRCLRIKEVRDR